MPPVPPKKIIQTPAESVPDAIQATAIVVIHPGSMFLRMGRPSDPFPVTIPHVVARRCKTNSPQIHRDSYLVPHVAMDRPLTESVEETLISTQRVLASCLMSNGSMRYIGSREKIREYNSMSKASILSNAASVRWTNVDPNEDLIVGEEVLHLNPDEPFHIHWPIRRGKLNLHRGVGGSLTSVLSDLEVIWLHTIEKSLEIPQKDFHHYRAVLVIPDVYNRKHVKELVDLLLTRLGFSGCFVHLESVCATFGAGLSYACVVDVGDQKVTVSCVEDGISHRNSRLHLEYGGSDITRFFYWLLNRNAFPYRDCNAKFTLDGILLRELKEHICHLNLDVCGLHEQTFQVKIPGQPVQKFNLMVGDECLMAPLSLFNVELLAMTGTKQTSMLKLSDGDPEDPHDHSYLIQTQRRGNKEVNEGNPGADHMDDPQDDDLDPTEGHENEREVLCDQLYSVDQAIIQSIERCESDELKRKMYGCVLVVGGGMGLFPGISTWLANRLALQTPLAHRAAAPLDIIVRPKDMDPRMTVWKGAAVMSCLDTAQELWIRQKEWQRYGLRVLRERAPFTW